jgi:hypothetical protein
MEIKEIINSIKSKEWAGCDPVVNCV